MSKASVRIEGFCPSPDRAIDLFDYFDVPLPVGATPSPFTGYEMAGRPIPNSSWILYCNTGFDAGHVGLETEETEQLLLDLRGGSGQVATFISPSCSAFMNASIRGLFRTTRLQQAAAEHLMRQNVLYLGDLTLMAQHELLHRLGPYVGQMAEIERQLADVGLSLEAKAPWWRRPPDYYRQTF